MFTWSLKIVFFLKIVVLFGNDDLWVAVLVGGADMWVAVLVVGEDIWVAVLVVILVPSSSLTMDRTLTMDHESTMHHWMGHGPWTTYKKNSRSASTSCHPRLGPWTEH